jgi:hypothetical protein
MKLKKKYYCECNFGVGGHNCSFSNKTELELLQNKSFELMKKYQGLSMKEYIYEFLSLATKHKDLMTDNILPPILSLVQENNNKWHGKQ